MAAAKRSAKNQTTSKRNGTLGGRGKRTETANDAQSDRDRGAARERGPKSEKELYGNAKGVS
jgi:hypothetical protein